MIDEQNELLRYIAGSIIRQLVRNGVSVGSFWPTGVDIVAHTAFLEPQVQSPQWLEMFEGYLDSLDSQTEYHNEYVLLHSLEGSPNSITENLLPFLTSCDWVRTHMHHGVLARHLFWSQYMDS